MDSRAAKRHFRKMVAMRILEWRQKDGAYQEDLAELLGIQQPAYCKIEQGVTNLTAWNAYRLAVYFGKSLDELLCVQSVAPKGSGCSVEKWELTSQQLDYVTIANQLEQLQIQIKSQSSKIDHLVSELIWLCNSFVKLST